MTTLVQLVTERRDYADDVAGFCLFLSLLRYTCARTRTCTHTEARAHAHTQAHTQINTGKPQRRNVTVAHTYKRDTE